ncbi:ABC transporter, phosphonate, periplasmic substrate-binding protein [Mycolicibacterium flavescens]|uniref:PhnD/SsuA/transferrin family substrate-binding protein n=1 Tax=Mycobacterium neumannii TaxID=2048551 RepID=UPI000B946061|nr:PhnD/SsuA/transferrin family substrate-binding protein [Mycobacterium neumannii]VEG38560.1 ABC transporter, phosphonate, periplasmic substrate-binding protein [Mycolicibacterium flavescens]
MLSFVVDQNLGLPACDEPWTTLLAAEGISAAESTDLAGIDRALAQHQPDIAYVPAPSLHRLLRSGDHHYRGLAIATSKFTGEPRQTSVLVVRRDDAASGLDDLAGAQCGYINTSCTSSYFAPAILFTGQRKLAMHFVAVPPWQGQIDAVVSGRVRATMVLEDVWKMTPENASTTRIVARYDNCRPPVVLVKEAVDNASCATLLDALLTWVPDWSGVYGALKPFYYADVHGFFHDLDQLTECPR